MLSVMDQLAVPCGGKANITGGSVEATGDKFVSAIKLTNSGTVNVSGGSISGTSISGTGYGIYARNSTAVVLGGTVNGIISNDNDNNDNPGFIAIFGGIFDHDPDAYVAIYCTANPNKPTDGLWTVTPKDTTYVVGAVSKTYVDVDSTGLRMAFKSIKKAIETLGTNTDGVIYLLDNVKELGELTGMIPTDNVEIDEPTAEFENASVGSKKKVLVTYTLKGEQAGNYTVAVSETEANINAVPQPAKEEPAAGLYVKPVTLETLNTVQQAAVEAVTSDGTQELVNVVEVSLVGAAATAEDGRYTFTIKAEILKGNNASRIRVWFLNADGTMTEVKFTVDANGNIVILSGLLGNYVVTVDNTIAQNIEKT